MVEISDFIPEILSFIFGLLLSLMGVPSIIEIGIMIITAIQEVLPSTYGSLYIMTLRFLGWFFTIEPVLRIIILLKDRF